jgi:Integrase core domain
MRDQLVNGELFYTLKEAQIIIERWRIHYNTVRPHSSLGGLPPAPKPSSLRAEDSQGRWYKNSRLVSRSRQSPPSRSSTDGSTSLRPA